ncbi:MAG: histidine triad nucleotide-binding protein [Candidatus Gastranaerophilales bacterium]|nr:histidine triad nucleotide-binding protein [Candidatus Gastranaerophilales bacterium]
MTDCIFCKIANHEIPTTPVFENDKVIAFNDLNPQAPTHILVIPKQHVASVSDVKDLSVMQDLFDAIQQITTKNNIKDFRTVINTGSGAGQTVFHLHIHILAGRPLLWPPG